MSKSPGERRNSRLRFEQWAQNPLCEANTISAVLGISMADVARAEGVPPTMGQSPFALARGNRFERGLFREDAARIRRAMVEAGVLQKGAHPFLDLRTRRNGGRVPNLQRALVETQDLFRKVASCPIGDRDALPGIVAGAAVSLPGGVMLPEAVLVLDVLVIRYDQNRPTLVVGEIKTYPDRGGHTDGSQLATARAQAGVYVHGLHLVVSELGLRERLDVSTTGFLVLSRPGYNLPSIRAGEDLRYQARRAERGFVRLRAAAAALAQSGSGAVTPGNTPSANVDAVLNAKCEYDESCVSFCDRAAACQSRAVEQGNPSALGADVARFLNGIDLHRAIALLGGAQPLSAAEADLVRRVVEAKSLGGHG
jgi:hypothetical protein